MSDFLQTFHINVPIIQAGMAGGITTPALVAAVANTGALGTIGAGYMSDSTLKEEIQLVREMTDKPFAVNLFATNLEACTTETQEMQTYLNKYRYELKLDHASNLVKMKDYLQEKVNVILEEKIQIVSTAFGVLSPMLIKQMKDRHVLLIGMATNLDEAKQLVNAGYDAVVAQGFEAGGHRGTFDIKKYPDGSDIGLLVLVQSLMDNLSVPIIAAGGIHSKEQIKALLTMGVEGVQLGTKFLLAKEAGTNDAYRKALLRAGTNDTVITKVFSGRPARAIRNRFIREIEGSNLDIQPFPIQNAMTKDIRAAGSKMAASDFLSLWAGQGVGAVNRLETVEEIIYSLESDS